MHKNDAFAVICTQRAEKLRSIASNVRDADTQDAMLKWADDYDRLAQQAIEAGTFDRVRKPPGARPQNPVIAPPREFPEPEICVPPRHGQAGLA